MAGKDRTRTLTIRVPEDVHEALRTLAFATNTSINDIAVRALRDHLAHEGHRRAVEALLAQARKRYRVALDKLADLQVRYLTAGDVLRIHEAEVSPRPIVDIGLLESAVLRPMETVGGRDAYPDIHAKAAALFHSLIRNHPFVDGNKRTAVLSLVVFYNLNGFELEAADDDMVVLAVDAAEGSLDVATIAGRLASWARPLRLP